MNDESCVYSCNSFFGSLCKQREFDKATKLLEVECINVNWKDMLDETHLMIACEEENIDAVSFLLEKGADVNAKQYFQNCQGVTALLKAAAGGYTEIVKILLENGADVYAKTGAGNTALMKASEGGYIEAVSMLVEMGADVNAKDNWGMTALMKARQRGHEAVVRLIINHMNRMTLLVVEKGRTKDENPLATHSHNEIAKHIASFLL